MKLSVAVFQRADVEMDLKGNKFLNETDVGQGDALMVELVLF